MYRDCRSCYKNEIVERKQKHILETARSLLFQSNLPIKFGGDCIQCVVHLINKMPLTIFKGKTAYESCFGKSPKYEYLKVFGNLCFVSTLNKGGHKFHPIAQKCVFIGCSPNKKKYKV